MTEHEEAHKDKALTAIEGAIQAAGAATVQERGPIYAQVAVAEAILHSTDVLIDIRDQLERVAGRLPETVRSRSRANLEG